jgi:hypothetical protein
MNLSTSEELSSLNHFRMWLLERFDPARVAAMGERVPMLYDWLHTLSAISMDPTSLTPDFIEDRISVMKEKNGSP